MADFSSKETQLANPKEAEPIKSFTPIDVPFQIPTAVTNVLDIFAKGLVQDRKDQAEEVKNGVVGAYVREQSSINNAVASGQMSASEAAARQRASGNKFISSYPQYAKDFLEANNSLKGITEKGEIEEQIKTEQKHREQLIEQAQKAGYVVPPNSDKVAQDAIINASQSAVRVRQQWEDQLKVNAEKRAQGTFDQQQADREQKDQSLKLITSLAADNINALSALGTSLSDRARSGSLSFDQARADAEKQYAQMQAVVQAAAGTNPELAAPYRTLLSGIHEINIKLLDPNAPVKDLENQKKSMITKAQIMALTKPEVLAAAATADLLPNAIPLQKDIAAVEAALLIQKTAPGSPIFNQTVGNPAHEVQTYDLLNKSIDAYNSGKAVDAQIAKTEVVNSVNNILKQTKNLSDTSNASPDSLRAVAKFFAGPQFGSMVDAGAVNPQLAQVVKQVFQINYEPAVKTPINKRLAAPLFTPTVKSNSTGDEIRVAEAVKISFNGTGVMFEPRTFVHSNGSAPLDIEINNQNKIIKALKSAQDGLNELIHIGAHMERTTDYQSYWEENKHILLPVYFPDPNLIKVGQVVNGWRYDGGPWKSPNSYTKGVGNGGK